MFVRSPSAYLRSCNSPWEAIKKVTDNYQHLTTVNKVSIFSGITLGPLGIYYIAGIRAALVGGFALLGLVVIVINRNNPEPKGSNPTTNKAGTTAPTPPNPYPRPVPSAVPEPKDSNPTTNKVDTIASTPPNPTNPYPRPFPSGVEIITTPVPEPRGEAPPQLDNVIEDFSEQDLGKPSIPAVNSSNSHSIPLSAVGESPIKKTTAQNPNPNILPGPGNVFNPHPITVPEMNTGGSKEVVLKKHEEKSVAIALDTLLPEIIQTILLGLDLKNISVSSLVCKKFNLIAIEDNFWIRLRARDFPFHPPIKNSPLNPCDVYKSDFTCRSNLKRGRYTSTLLPSQFPGVTILSRTVANGKIFLGSNQGTIEIINIKTNESLAVLSKKGSCVTSLAVMGNMLFSGYLDGAIDVWDLDERKCINTLKGHSKMVISLVICEGESETSSTRLISGSADTTIKIWDPMRAECLSTLEGHKSEVNTLIVYEDHLFSCAFADCKIKIWNFRNPVPECLHTVSGYKFDIFNGELFTCDEKSIHIWNPKTGEKLGSLEVSNNLTFIQLFILDGMLFSVDDDKTKIWDVKTRKCLGTFSRLWFGMSGRLEPTSFIFDDGKIFLRPWLDGVHFLDFKVDLSEIFADIAATYRKIPEFEVGGYDSRRWLETLSRFERMPYREKEEVCKEVDGAGFYSGKTANMKRARAIENWLSKRIAHS